VEASGVRLWCRELGDGPPLVLLHPGPDLDGEILFPWFERLAATHRLVVPDLPGSGRSDVAPVELRTIEGYADVAHALIGELGVERPAVLRHSFGSFVALAYGIRHAGEPAGIVASCGAASEEVFDELEERVAAFEPAELRERAVAAFEHGDDAETTEELRNVWADQMPFFCADPSGPGCRALVAALERSHPRPAAEDEGPQSYDVRAELARLTAPLLVIGGAEDRSTPPFASEEIARLAPNAELRWVPRTGHFPYAEDPDAYFGVLERWL
jgi:pimeloyl-ACP methyl ester carboxylesterase